MTGTNSDTTCNLLQYIVFALLFVTGLLTILLVLWRQAAYRERLLDTCCINCSNLCVRRVHYDEADLRTLRELEQPQRERVGINGAYRMYQARRSRLSLRLASWREDVKCSGGYKDLLHHKLAQIRASQSRLQQTQSVAVTTTSRASTNQAILAPTIPLDIRVVEVNDHMDTSSSISSNVSDFSHDSNEETVYRLIQFTPQNKPSVRSGRRSFDVAGEDEEKEDVPSRDCEIV